MTNKYSPLSVKSSLILSPAQSAASNGPALCAKCFFCFWTVQGSTNSFRVAEVLFTHDATNARLRSILLSSFRRRRSSIYNVYFGFYRQGSSDLQLLGWETKRIGKNTCDALAKIKDADARTNLVVAE